MVNLAKIKDHEEMKAAAKDAVYGVIFIIVSLCTLGLVLQNVVDNAKLARQNQISAVLTEKGYEDIFFMEDLDTNHDDYMIVNDEKYMTFVGVIKEIDRYASADYLHVDFNTKPTARMCWGLSILVNYEREPELAEQFLRMTDDTKVIIRAKYNYDSMGGYISKAQMVYAYASLDEFDPPTFDNATMQ